MNTGNRLGIAFGLSLFALRSVNSAGPVPGMKARPPQAVEDCHDILLWLIPLLDKFPRNRRFTLGERMESRLLTVLEDLVDAAYRRDKSHSLRQANRNLEICRHLWRLSHELQLVSTRQYEHGSRLLLNLGKQIGGWLRVQP